MVMMLKNNSKKLIDSKFTLAHIGSLLIRKKSKNFMESLYQELISENALFAIDFN